MRKLCDFRVKTDISKEKQIGSLIKQLIINYSFRRWKCRTTFCRPNPNSFWTIRGRGFNFRVPTTCMLE
ncbi:hypothetical protein RIR_jg2643.t1 [Rhizophagus irregularis DAOM 181602=DAOM 197198]|uniref:Uncharacterized protein n=1 Tax=Rhizophagus irregularis (strain DAOM 181602 / DAOM 197198 / MUCL 43194) TaxID=747089 RepID=U9TT27_RHIID|nr:hypothetical protein RIR_jg2643.t1 [Rhizophagus irregularis DAOM 181602=DAOM 197198]